jgi:hypothetical protein
MHLGSVKFHDKSQGVGDSILFNQNKKKHDDTKLTKLKR